MTVEFENGWKKWRIDTSVSTKQNDTNRIYGMRHLLNCQQLRKRTPCCFICFTVFFLAIHPRQSQIFCELNPVWPFLSS